MKSLKENAIIIIAFAILIFAVAFTYGQYRLALEHNRQIILRCVEKEGMGGLVGVSYDACMVLWKPFLIPFAPKEHGSY